MSKLQLDGWRFVCAVSDGDITVQVTQNARTFRVAVQQLFSTEVISARDGTARGALGIAKVRAEAAGMGGMYLEAAISEIEDQLGLETSVDEACAHHVPCNDFCPACGRVVHREDQP